MSCYELSETPLIDDHIALEKFPGKGGWTFARLPDVSQDKKNPFGWRKVKGFIDEVEIRQCHLMPMGDGQLFLPVKAAIRKAIKKDAGDVVSIKLLEDSAPPEIPEEFIICLDEEPNAREMFFSLTPQIQKKVIDTVYASKREDIIVERIALAINRLAEGKIP